MSRVEFSHDNPLIVPSFPRHLRYVVEAIPPELTSGCRGVCFHCTPQTDGRLKKVPIRPGIRPDRRGGHLARSDDPSTWAPWPECVRSAEVRLLYLGVALTLDGGVVLIDMDGVIDAAGVVDPLAAELVRSLDTYCEVSASRKGLHCLGFADPPGRGVLTLGPGRTPLELAPRKATRFCLLTGFVVPPFTALRPIGESLGARLTAPPKRERSPHARASPVMPPSPIGLTDSERARLVRWATGHWTHRRHDLALYLAGVLKNAGISRADTRLVIEAAAKAAGDDELRNRLDAVEATFDHPGDVAGLSGLKGELGFSEAALVTLRAITQAAAARRYHAAHPPQSTPRPAHWRLLMPTRAPQPLYVERSHGAVTVTYAVQRVVDLAGPRVALAVVDPAAEEPETGLPAVLFQDRVALDSLASREKYAAAANARANGSPILAAVSRRRPGGHAADRARLGRAGHQWPRRRSRATSPSSTWPMSDLERASARCWEALLAANEPPRLFVYGGNVSRIERDPDTAAPVPRPLNASRLRYHVARAASFIDEEGQPVAPPLDVGGRLLADPAPPLPLLRGLVEIPSFAAGWQHCPTEPGLPPGIRRRLCPTTRLRGAARSPRPPRRRRSRRRGS